MDEEDDDEAVDGMPYGDKGDRIGLENEGDFVKKLWGSQIADPRRSGRA